MSHETDKFVIQCKSNYFKKVTPSNSSMYHSEAYKRTVEIGISCIKELGVENFSNFFQEVQYLIDLWAAHLIIEHATSSENLKKQAIGIIKEYSNNFFSPIVAKEEDEWLKTNASQYKKYL